MSVSCVLPDRGIGNDNTAEVDVAGLIWANFAIAEALVKEIKDRDGDGNVDVREGLGEAQRVIARLLCDRLNEGASSAARAVQDQGPPAALNS